MTAEFWCGKEGGPAKSSAEIVSRDAKDYGVPEGPDSDYDPVRPCSRLKPEVLRPVTSCLYDSGSHSHYLFPIPIPIPFPFSTYHGFLARACLPNTVFVVTGFRRVTA